MPAAFVGRHGRRVARKPDNERLRKRGAVGVDRFVEYVLGIGEDLDAGVTDAAQRDPGR